MGLIEAGNDPLAIIIRSELDSYFGDEALKDENFFDGERTESLLQMVVTPGVRYALGEAYWFHAQLFHQANTGKRIEESAADLVHTMALMETPWSPPEYPMKG